MTSSQSARKLQRLLASQAPAPLEAGSVLADPVASAQAAGLRYVNPSQPGIRRLRRGKSFTYLDPAGRTVRDEATLKRIRSLAIPPAYEDVWICARTNGHLQATGRDARGRTQYRYHPEWRAVRDAVKYHRMLAFGKALPRLRRRVARDLKLRGMPREKVLAAVVGMLEQTLVRVGNDEYREKNQSFGLTTLRNRHVRVKGTRARFNFRGKSGKMHDVELDDPRLVRVVRQCLDIPGHELFQWVDDDGQPRSVESSDVNEYLREATGDDFTAKDFRTWAGTVLAARFLRAGLPLEVPGKANEEVSKAVALVAEELRNTPAVCRKCYVHPAVIDAYIGGMMKPLVVSAAGGKRGRATSLSAEERDLLELLRQGAKTLVSAGSAAA